MQYVRIYSRGNLTTSKELYMANDFIDFNNTWTKYEMSIHICVYKYI